MKTHISKIFDSECKKRVELVSGLKLGSKIHLSATCGTGMSAVLKLLKDAGFYCTGSDKAFYPPMGSVVKDLADEIFEGYNSKNIAKDVDLVVIGNALSIDNPEVQYVLENKIPYASMAEVFSALLIGKRDYCAKSIVVTGTHGKTTTTSMLAELLEASSREPGYFIGAIPTNLPSGLRMVSKNLEAKDRTVVLEGDEYDCAFFAKFAKFQCYRADIVIITSLEFDHADIYSSIEEIEEQFMVLISKLPDDGLVLACREDKGVLNLINKLKEEDRKKVKFYGKIDSEYKILEREVLEGKQKLTLDLNGETKELELKVSGEYNALNALSALAVAKELDIEVNLKGLENFRGALRRQQLIFDKNDIKVIEDFAHHPTAVAKTLKGIKEAYPNSEIIAVFEPRSNTSRQDFFQAQYAKAFDSADKVIIKTIDTHTSYSKNNTESKVLDLNQLVREISIDKTDKAILVDSVEEISNTIISSAKSGKVVNSKKVFVLMSNGAFGGLPKMLVEKLKKQCK